MGVSHLLDCIENEIGLRLLRWGLGGRSPPGRGGSRWRQPPGRGGVGGGRPPGKAGIYTYIYICLGSLWGCLVFLLGLFWQCSDGYIDRL